MTSTTHPRLPTSMLSRVTSNARGSANQRVHVYTPIVLHDIKSTLGHLVEGRMGNVIRKMMLWSPYNYIMIFVRVKIRNWEVRCCADRRYRQSAIVPFDVWHRQGHCL